jgi:hypothetical protein
MSEAGPDYERVAAVLVTISLRLVSEQGAQGNEEKREGADVDRGLLQGLDGGTSGGGVLDRRAG